MLLWIIAVPLLAALLAPAAHRLLRASAGWLLAAAPLTSLWLTVRAYPTLDRPIQAESLAWLPSLGVSFALRLDGLAALFCLLILGIGALILIYAAGYMAGDRGAGRLFSYLLLFMSAMLGVVLADDLITLFVFWELTSITSFLLIGFKHEAKYSRAAALQALLITGGGGLAMLAGFVLLGAIVASAGAAPETALRLSAMTAYRDAIQAHALYAPAAILILLGAFTKSAQLPFSFWLPGAMAAPTPVSAYLHSATMVKAGVFLLARLNPTLGGSELWQITVTSVGAATMLTAATLAICQHDLKRILAYTTCSVLGTLTMLIGLGTSAAIKAAVVFVAAHALYKAALFMIAGNIDHAAGSRDVLRLGGLARFMPITAGAAVLAALSMAGAPPFFGFIGKELVVKSKLDVDTISSVLIVLAGLANVMMIATALIVSTWPFFGRPAETLEHPHEAPVAMLIGPALLAAAGLCVGLFPALFDAHIGPAAASAIAGVPLDMTLKLWYGANPIALAALIISGVTIMGGIWLSWRLREHITTTIATVQRLAQYGPARGYELLLDGTLAFAARLTRIVQSGSLRRYATTIILFTVLLISVPLVRAMHPQLSATELAVRWYELPVLALMLIGGLIAITAKSRLSAVAGLGGTGLSIALLFAVYSAPDLALTLVLVETLTVILFVLIFYRLPSIKDLRSPRQRILHAGIALAAGAMMSTLVLATASVRYPPHVADHLSQISVPEAYGRNVVNVILVDFRALDTLGEITVVAVAALGVFALLRLGPAARQAVPLTTPDEPAEAKR